MLSNRRPFAGFFVYSPLVSQVYMLIQSMTMRVGGLNFAEIALRELYWHHLNRLGENTYINLVIAQSCPFYTSYGASRAHKAFACPC